MFIFLSNFSNTDIYGRNSIQVEIDIKLQGYKSNLYDC